MKYQEFYRLFDDFDRRRAEIQTPEGMKSIREKLTRMAENEAPAIKAQADEIFEQWRQRQAQVNQADNDAVRIYLECEEISLRCAVDKAGFACNDLESESLVMQGEIAAADGDFDRASGFF